MSGLILTSGRDDGYNPPYNPSLQAAPAPDYLPRDKGMDAIRTSWQHTPHTWSATQDGITVILALDRGRYYRLNSVAGHIWKLTEQPTQGAEVVQQLSKLFGAQVTTDVLASDVARTLTALEAADLVTPSAVPARGRSIARPSSSLRRLRRVPSTLYCLLHLVYMQVATRLVGERRLIESVHRLDWQRAGCPGELDKVVRATSRAIALCPWPVGCFPRSLSAAAVLRRLGYSARVRIGVVAYPFLAHAWVEVEGVPLNERPEGLSKFEVFPDVGIP